MRQSLSYVWGLFVASSWTLGLCVIFVGVSPLFYFLSVVFGLVVYALKLYYFNNLTLLQLNYLTIIYYLVLYSYTLFIGLCVWDLIHWAFIKVDANYFERLFPHSSIFESVSRRSILAASAMSLAGGVNIGLHRHIRFFVFTNRVRLIEVVFIAMSLLLLVIGGWRFMPMFVTITAIFSMPDTVKLKISEVMKKKFNKDIDLVNMKIENNSVDDKMVTTWDGYVVFILTAIISTLIGDGLLQLQIAALILVLGAITPPFH